MKIIEISASIKCVTHTRAAQLAEIPFLSISRNYGHFASGQLASRGWRESRISKLLLLREEQTERESKREGSTAAGAPNRAITESRAARRAREGEPPRESQPTVFPSSLSFFHTSEHRPGVPIMIADYIRRRLSRRIIFG